MSEITQHSGEYNIENYLKAASEVFAMNDVVTKDASGYLTKATSATPRSEVLGLIQRTVLATDGDYADNSAVGVLVTQDNPNEFLMPVENGTPAQTMVGKAYDLNSEDGIDVEAQVKKHFKITAIVSSTVVRGRFLSGGEDEARLVTYKETVAVADLTDGGGAAGTVALAASIPAGAVFVQSMLKNITGFAGDTSAVITIGDGTDVDRYNTGTPNVFATAAAGVDAGVPSGTKFHATAKTPTVTITSATDIGLVITDGNGEVEITLMWYEAD